MSRCVIDVQELHHIYGEGSLQAQVALSGVNLTVNAGEIVVLLGSTGSGKSTLLQHLNGILSGNKGRVVVLDQDMNDPATDLRALRQAVGLVFQRPENQLFERYVGDDIAYGPRLAGLQGVALRERVKWAMDVVDLDFEAFKDRSTFTLSGGERRRLEIARALATKLDSPALSTCCRDSAIPCSSVMRSISGRRSAAIRRPTSSVDTPPVPSRPVAPSSDCSTPIRISTPTSPPEAASTR